MKRLTLHLNRVTKKTELKKEGTYNGKSVSKIFNTLSFIIENEDDAQRIIAHINENESPRNNVKKWYISNIR